MPSHPSFDLFCRFSLFELPLCVGSQRLTDGFRSKQSRKAKIQLDCSEARSFSSACLENCTAKDPFHFSIILFSLTASPSALENQHVIINYHHEQPIPRRALHQRPRRLGKQAIVRALIYWCRRRTAVHSSVRTFGLGKVSFFLIVPTHS